MKGKRKSWIFLAMVCAMVVLISGTFAVMATESTKQPESEVTESAIVSPNNIKATKYDIVFVIDNSGSIWEQQEKRDEALRAISNLAEGADIRIGGVYFGDHVSKKLSLTSMSQEGGKEAIRNFLNMTEQDDNNIATNIGNALEQARQLLSYQSEDREPVIILFSDGINEKLGGDVNYKNAADIKTKQQVQALESENVPIYCVYLQKDYNAESYLREIVNFFNPGNSFDKTRFKMITEDKIHTLAKQFAEVFYTLQNNMTCKEFTVDSNGNMNFYVPSLGVERLQLYFYNPEKYEIVISNETTGTDNEMTVNKDGQHCYVTIINPAVGEWSVKVSGAKKEQTKVTLAYYADVKSSTVFTKNGESVKDIYKNDEVQVQAKFFNSNGEEIAVDEKTLVNVNLVKVNESGERTNQALVMGNTDGKSISEPFVLDEYGTYRLETAISYQEFVDMSYIMPECVVQGKAPVTYNQDGVFYSKEVEGKESFSIECSSVFKDPENEEVAIGSVKQLDDENQVTAVLKEDFLVINADSPGNIECEITLIDSTGLSEEVLITGYVVNKMDIMKICIAILVIIVILIVCKIVSSVKKKKTVRSIDVAKQSIADAKTQIKEYSNYLDDEHDGAKLVNNYLSSKNSLADLCAVNNMQQFHIDSFDGTEYLKDDEKYVKAVNKDISDFKGRKAGINKLLNYSAEDIKNVKSIKKLKKILSGLNEALTELKEAKNSLVAYDASMCDVKMRIGALEKAKKEVKTMLDTPIGCDLIIGFSSYNGRYEGEYRHSGFNGPKRGFCDITTDVTLFGDRGEEYTYRSRFDSTRQSIIMCGKKNDEGQVGIELISSEGFRYGLEADCDEEEFTKSAFFARGMNYNLCSEGHKFVIKVR